MVTARRPRSGEGAAKRDANSVLGIVLQSLGIGAAWTIQAVLVVKRGLKAQKIAAAGRVVDGEAAAKASFAPAIDPVSQSNCALSHHCRPAFFARLAQTLPGGHPATNEASANGAPSE